MHTIAQPWMWGVFLVFVVLMLAVDLLLCGGNKAQKMTVKQAGYWTLIWVSMALLFAVGLYWSLGSQQGYAVAQVKTMEFLAGYLIEKSLSVDNIFIFLLIFTHFGVPPIYQRKVLLYGVLGAIVMRIGMILGGLWILEKFEWMMVVFGAFLIFTGIKMVLTANHAPDINTNPVIRMLKKLLPITSEYRHGHFSVVENGKRWFTPLMLVLVMIELSDVVFAVDSIPAVFAVTTDPFLVFTSNIFAIMGLRALYFLLADMAERFHFLTYGLALVLIFVGGKMLVADLYHVSTLVSLLVIILILTGSVMLSLWISKAPKKH